MSRKTITVPFWTPRWLQSWLLKRHHCLRMVRGRTTRFIFKDHVETHTCT